MAKIDVEQTMNRSDFARELRRFADALDQEITYEVNVKGQDVRVPSAGEMKIEYESKPGENEIDFQLSWK